MYNKYYNNIGKQDIKKIATTSEEKKSMKNHANEMKINLLGKY